MLKLMLWKKGKELGALEEGSCLAGRKSVGRLPITLCESSYSL